MTDVANFANVSVATVSNVINKRIPVSETKQKRVLKAIRKLGYQHNLAAKALKTGVSNTIGLLVPNLSSPYFSDISKTIIDIARIRGLLVGTIDTQNSSRKELSSLEFLFQHGVQGVIWYDPRASETEIRQQSAVNHVVIADRNLASFDCIYPEYENGGFELAQFVLSRGHTNIGLISGPQRNYAARLRRKGILKALKGNANVRWECKEEFSRPLSDKSIEKILQREVSIIMCGSDTIALSVMSVLRDASIVIPNEVSLTGFDDISMGNMVTPKLTTVGVPIATIANEAVDTLIQRTQGLESPKRHTSFDASVIIRDSVSVCN